MATISIGSGSSVGPKPWVRARGDVRLFALTYLGGFVFFFALLS